MITYLLASIVLSVLGMLLYRLFLSQNGHYVQQKVFLLSLIIASLSIPLLASSLLNTPSIRESSILLSTLFNEQHCSEAEIYQECKILIDEYGECGCERLFEQNALAMQVGETYEQAENYGPLLALAFSSIAGIVLLMLLVQLLFLLRLAHSKNTRLIQVHGKDCYLVQSPVRIGTGSFWLLGSYILWNPQLDQLNEEELEAVLLHELSHLQQKNTLELIGLRLLQCVWFINPVFYWIRHELILISEFMADEFVVQQQKDRRWYAQLLLRLQQEQSHPLISAFSGSQLYRRIDRIIYPKTKWNKHSFRLSLGFFLVLLFAMGLFIIVALESQLHHLDVQSTAANVEACKFCLQMGFPFIP
jgi:hypothetical protein